MKYPEAISNFHESWLKSDLEGVCVYIQRGKGPKYSDKPNNFPVVNQKAIRWHGIEQEHLKYVDPIQWEKWEAIRLIRTGDILWNSTGTGTVGRACYVTNTEANKAQVVDSHVTIVRTASSINSKFIFYWIMHPEVQRKVGGLFTGTTNQVELTKKMVQELEAPLPPLAEQKIIADKLDELLAQVDTLKARLDAIPSTLKRFRQSVLAAAVSGKLTEEWTNPAGRSSNWVETTLGQQAAKVTSGSRGWAKFYSDSGAIFIRSQDINTDELSISDTAYVSLPNGAEGTRTQVAESDILITITGANVTKCARIKSNLGEAYVSQHVALVKLRDKRHAPFVELCLKATNLGRKQLTDMAYGGGKPGLNLQNIKDVKFKLPNIEEQTEIVRRVEQLFTYADQVEQQVKNAQACVNQLTQSILAKAFRGELTEQWRKDNPELISGDNSATALLERIKAERAAATTIKKKAPARKAKA